MRVPRHADVLKESGYTGDLETFRATLADAKADLYPGIIDEILCFGTESSAKFCAEVCERLQAPRLGRYIDRAGLIDVLTRFNTLGSVSIAEPGDAVAGHDYGHLRLRRPAVSVDENHIADDYLVSADQPDSPRATRSRSDDPMPPRPGLVPGACTAG
jgi:hypothetical protein